MGITGEAINASGGDILNITKFVIENVGKLGLWIQALGLFVVIVLVFWIVSLILNWKKRRDISQIKQDLERIEKKIDRLAKKRK